MSSLYGATQQKTFFEKGEKIIHVVLKAVFVIKQNMVKGPAQGIQFLEVKW